jgi:hypothetical protein
MGNLEYIDYLIPSDNTNVRMPPTPKRKEGRGVVELIVDMLKLWKTGKKLVATCGILIDGILKEKSPPSYEVEGLVHTPLMGTYVGVIMTNPYICEMGGIVIDVVEMGGLISPP